MNLDQVIRRPGLHRLQVHLVLPRPGEENDRRLAAAFQGRSQEFDPVVRAQMIVHEHHIVLVPAHGFQAGVEGLDPVQREAPARNFGQQVPRDDEIILIILDQQDFD